MKIPSPMTMRLRQRFPSCFTTQEVADIVGRSKTTVERWRREGQLVPSKRVEFGKTVVWLYTKHDLELAKMKSRTR